LTVLASIELDQLPRPNNAASAANFGVIGQNSLDVMGGRYLTPIPLGEALICCAVRTIHL